MYPGHIPKAQTLEVRPNDSLNFLSVYCYISPFFSDFAHLSTVSMPLSLIWLRVCLSFDFLKEPPIDFIISLHCFLCS